MDDLKIAAVCMTALPGKIEYNLARIKAFVLEASARGADIVCFPEFSLTGYSLKDPSAIYRDLDSGLARKALDQLARKTGTIIIAGLVEFSEGEKPYITQIVTGNKGLIGRHQKTHLSPPEKEIYRAGQDIRVFASGDITFGIQLCYEAHFPELSTTMALMGADIIFYPHASPRKNPEEKLESWLRHLRARAFDNGVYIVACNLAGENGQGLSFPGVAVVLGPNGQELARYAGGKENILVAELKAAELHNFRQHRMKYFLPNRRPGLYKKVTL